MKRSDLSIKWNFPGVPTGVEAYFQPPVQEIPTGARWMGDYGVVMELCGVTFTWDMTFNESNNHQDITPGGYWIDEGAPNIGGNDQTGFVSYNAWLLTSGSKTRFALEDSLGGQVLAESFLHNTAVIIASTHNCRTVDTQFIQTDWDLTDGAGNGTIITAPTINLGGSCRYGQSNVNRDQYPNKVLKVPIGEVVQNQMPHTGVVLKYKHKRLNLQDWMGYAQNQVSYNDLM